MPASLPAIFLPSSMRQFSHLDQPAMRADREAAAFDLHYLAGLEAFHRGEYVHWDFLRLEEIEFLLTPFAPSARRGIAAADEVVNLVGVVRPVDLGFGGAAPAFIGRLRFILRDFGGRVL